MEAIYLGDNTGLAVSQVKGSSFVTSLAVIALVFNASGYLRLRAFAWLGLSSYAVYLAHMFVLSRLRGMLEGGPIFEEQPAYFMAAFVIVVAVMTAMIAVAKRLPETFKVRAIGA